MFNYISISILIFFTSLLIIKNKIWILISSNRFRVIILNTGRIKILKDIKFFFFFARRKKKEEMEVLDLKRTFYRKIPKH